MDVWNLWFFDKFYGIFFFFPPLFLGFAHMYTGHWLQYYIFLDSILSLSGYALDFSSQSTMGCTENYINVEEEFECALKCYQMDPACSAWSFSSPVCSISTCKLIRLKASNKSIVRIYSVHFILHKILIITFKSLFYLNQHVKLQRFFHFF